MHSLKSILVAVASFAVVAHCDYVIDPSTVPLSTRKAWCADEKRTCPIICQQSDPRPALVNECDPETLTYGCICGNNLQPNVSEFTLTLPYYTCTEWGTQCVKACGNNNICASNCRQNNLCGAQSPTKANTTSTTSTVASQTSSTGGVFNGLAGETSRPSAGSRLPSPIDLGRVYGLAAVLSGLFAGVFLL